MRQRTLNSAFTCTHGSSQQESYRAPTVKRITHCWVTLEDCCYTGFLLITSEIVATFDCPAVVKQVSYRSPRTQPNGIRYFNRSIRCQAPGSFKAHTRGPATETDDDNDDDMTFDGESILSNDNDFNWDDDATLMALLDE